MQVHGSCAARDGAGVLLMGPSGSGKSDLMLRLLSRGFDLVADDRVDIVDGVASAPAALAGMLEVRGLGLMNLPHKQSAALALVVALGPQRAARLPLPVRHAALDLPQVEIDATAASAPERVSMALDCALGRVTQHVGAFLA
jgi:HPr kinase/phosphorylase